MLTVINPQGNVAALLSRRLSLKEATDVLARHGLKLTGRIKNGHLIATNAGE